MIPLRQCVVIHVGDGIPLGVAPAGGLDASVQNAELRIRYNQVRIHQKLHAEAGAFGAGASGIIEGEQTG